MRWFFLLCSIALTTVWLLPESVVADNAAEESGVHEDRLAHAQSLEESLLAVEWYTNESVRKALHAEATGDNTNARLLGDKAIESDKKAKGLRLETANAWLAIHEEANAQAVWYRAAEMAKERALMLAKRIPALTDQWKSAGNAQAAPMSGQVSADARNQEVLYLQALFFTAQQWAVAADFYTRADDDSDAANAKSALQELIPLLVANNRLQALEADPRLKDVDAQIKGWQAGKLP